MKASMPAIPDSHLLNPLNGKQFRRASVRTRSMVRERVQSGPAKFPWDEGPHLDAVVLDSMVRNSRGIHDADLDLGGTLYSPLCFFLVAASRYLKVHLSPGHWQAALENLRSAEQTPGLELFGLSSSSPASRFKAELDAAIEQAGFLDRTSLLNKEDRNVAVGLAVNWAMRLLLAYAAEFPNPNPSSGRRDSPGWRLESRFFPSPPFRVKESLNPIPAAHHRTAPGTIHSGTTPHPPPSALS